MVQDVALAAARAGFILVPQTRLGTSQRDVLEGLAELGAGWHPTSVVARRAGARQSANTGTVLAGLEARGLVVSRKRRANGARMGRPGRSWTITQAGAELAQRSREDRL